MSKALRLLQITARHQDFPFLTVFSIIKTFSKISRPCWRKKAPVNDFVRFPVPRIIAEVKQVMGSFRCYDNSGVIAALMMTNCHLNTTVVAIFPNVCLRRRSLCSDLVLTLENCIEPPSQDGLCCCNMALISFRLFLKNLGNLKDIFGQMVYRPPWQKISRTPMDDRTDINFLASLRIHFRRSKSTPDSLKRVFNAIRRKLSLGQRSEFGYLLWNVPILIFANCYII